MTDDLAALRAACEAGTGLCTIVGIEGSFSRRLGAQLAVSAEGQVTGSLADGCLENQLAREVREGDRRVMRFGAGSALIDFRLPCGSGLDILVDPAPDHAAIRAAIARLDERAEASLDLPVGPADLLKTRRYMPPLRLILFGEGPELEVLATLSSSLGLDVQTHDRNGRAMALGRAPMLPSPDRWTAVILLFHDHEWEQAILEWALGSPAFFIGAQGGRAAREERVQRLQAAGIDTDTIARITSPIGVTGHSREPAPLAVSTLAQVMGQYEAIHPHNHAYG